MIDGVLINRSSEKQELKSLLNTDVGNIKTIIRKRKLLLHHSLPIPSSWENGNNV